MRKSHRFPSESDTARSLSRRRPRLHSACISVDLLNPHACGYLIIMRRALTGFAKEQVGLWPEDLASVVVSIAQESPVLSIASLIVFRSVGSVWLASSPSSTTRWRKSLPTPS